MRARATWAFGVVVASFGASAPFACVSGDFADAQFACSPGGACPPDTTCGADGFCRRGGSAGFGDGASGGDDSAGDGPLGDAANDGTAPISTPCSGATWSVATSSRGPFAVAAEEDTLLYVGGGASTGGAAFLLRVNACTGDTLLDRPVSLTQNGGGATQQITAASSAAIDAGTLVVAVRGTSSSSADTANLTRIDPLTFGVLDAGPQFQPGSDAGAARIDELSFDEQGGVWGVGTRNGAATGWLVHDGPQGRCSVIDTSVTARGMGGVAATTGGEAYVGRTIAPKGNSLAGRVTRFSPSACTSTFESADVLLGRANGRADAVVTLGGSIYVAGSVTADDAAANTQAYVARLDPSSATIASSWILAPQSNLDAASFLATDGESLYVVVQEALDTTSNATAAVVRLTPALTPAAGWSQPVRLPLQDRTQTVTALTVSRLGGDGIFVTAANGASSGTIVRCSKQMARCSP